METHYSSIDREGLGIDFHHYYFTHKVNMIMNHKPLVVIFKKDDTNLSYRFQRILLWIHQYIIRILYKPGLQLFICDLLSRHNQKGNSVEEIPCMCITINMMEPCMEVPDCLKTEEIRAAILEDEDLNALMEFILFVGNPQN